MERHKMRLSKEAWAHKKKTDERRRVSVTTDRSGPGTFEGYVNGKLDQLEGDAQVEFLLDSIGFIREYDEQINGTERRRTEEGSGVSQLIDAIVERNPRTVLARFKLQQGDNDDDDYRLVCKAENDRTAGFQCSACAGDLVRDTANNSLICTECGLTTSATHVGYGNVLTPTDHETMTIETKFLYKRINHFNEWITSLQGRENTDIPDEVVEKVRAEFVKARLTDPQDITQNRVRGFLKKLNYNKMYEHSHNICRALGGTCAELIPPDLEATLKTMFAQIQEPFERVKPPERKNFLSYSYVLYKFMQLLGKDEYLRFLPLLKSSEKLFAQDKIFKQICNILHWQFIPTI